MINKILIDGQEILALLTKEAKLDFFSQLDGVDKVIDDELLKVVHKTFRYFSYDIKKILLSEEIIFGFAKLPSNKYFLYFFVSLNDESYRVNFERIRCLNCQSSYLIGNPSISDNFIGLNSIRRIRAEERAMKIMKYSCPNCQAKLSRPYVWMQKIESSE